MRAIHSRACWQPLILSNFETKAAGLSTRLAFFLSCPSSASPATYQICFFLAGPFFPVRRTTQMSRPLTDLPIE